MKKIFIKVLLVVISILFCADLIAQEYDDNGNEIKERPFSIRGLSYGFNIGAYFPNSKVASYYNGEPGKKLSLYNTLINKTLYNNTHNYNYDNISNDVFNGDDFEIYDYAKMSYSAAANIGFHAKYNFSNRTGIYIEFNYSKLKAQGGFDLKRINGIGIDEPSSFGLITNEQRVDINFGVSKSFGKLGRFMPYAEAAFNLNNTTVKSADALIGNNKYSYLNQYDEYYNLRDYGIGNGGLVGGGLQIIATNSLILHTGIDFSLKKIHLGNNGAYSLNTVLYIRILFYKFISTKPEA